jgi:tetratricopeptide (TPR) repeat protein
MDHLNELADRLETVQFYAEAFNRAIVYRLSLAQQGAANSEILERELPNLLGAARQSYIQQNWDMVTTFCDALQPSLNLRGSWKECLLLLDWAQHAAERLQDGLSVARYIHDQADILNQQGRYREAEELYQRSEHHNNALGAVELGLKSRHMRSMVVRAQGRLAESEQLNMSTVAEAQKLGLKQWLAHPLYVRGLIARDRRDLREAKLAVEQGLTLLSDREDLTMIAQCRHFLGEVAILEGNLVMARSELEMSLQLSRQAGIVRRVAATQRLLGDLARMEGHDEAAEKIYHDALEIVAQLGDQPQLARLLLSQSQLMMRRKELPEAINLLLSSGATYALVGDKRGVAVTSILLAQLYFRQGRIHQASRMVWKATIIAWRAQLIQPEVLLGMLQRWKRL